jgi:DNA-binding NarL/FixJ family response regulator
MTSTEDSRRRAPLILVEDHEHLADVAAELTEAGWSVRDGFLLHEQAWSVSGMRPVCQGAVATADDAAAALLAAARGAGILAAVSDRDTQARLFEDLGRIGPVQLRRRESNDRAARLTPEHRELLELLAGGASLNDAARMLNYSVRTVERRLAAARAALGVTTTAEALMLLNGRPPD